MTDATPDPSLATDSSSAPASGQQAARQHALAELRRRHPQWVVQWLAQTGRYHGYPLYTQRPSASAPSNPPTFPP